MANLIANIVGGRDFKAHERHLNVGRARAGEIYYVGAIVTLDEGGFVRPASSIADATPGARHAQAAGVVVENPLREDPGKNVHLDNTNGADGSFSGDKVVRGVRYDTVGEYAFDVQGVPSTGRWAYVVDDATVSTKAPSSAIIVGKFTRPHLNGRWFVDISKMNTPPALLNGRILDLSAAFESYFVVSTVFGNIEVIRATTDGPHLTSPASMEFYVDGVRVSGGGLTLPPGIGGEVGSFRPILDNSVSPGSVIETRMAQAVIAAEATSCTLTFQIR